MNKERNFYMDALKAINIILVVLGHCIQYGSGKEYALGAFFYNPVFIFIYSFHMPLFMLISGCLFASSIKTKKWNELLYAKFKQLIIPLCSWSVISLFISIGKSSRGLSSESINVLWIVKKLISGFVYGPWFLWAVWWCSFVIIVVRRFFRDSPIVYFLGSVLTFVITDALNLALYKFMWPFFLFAYIFNTYDYRSKLKKIYLNKGFIACTFIVFGFLLFFYNYDSYIYTSGYSVLNKNVAIQIYTNCFRFIIGMVGSISTMYLIYVLVRVLPNAMNNLLSYIGKNTLGIYIISGIVFAELLPKITSSLKGINYLYIFIETMGVLCFSILINALLKRFKITNRLFLGGR